MHGKENLRRIYRYYGIDAYGFSDLPHRLGSHRIASLINGPNKPCYKCFSAGIRIVIRRKRDDKKCWKTKRLAQHNNLDNLDSSKLINKSRHYHVE